MNNNLVCYSKNHPISRLIKRIGEEIKRFYFINAGNMYEISLLRQYANLSTTSNISRRNIAALIGGYIERFLKNSPIFCGIFWGDEDLLLPFLRGELTRINCSWPIYYTGITGKLRCILGGPDCSLTRR